MVCAKSNLLWRRRYSRPIDKELDLRCDQTIVLTGAQTAAKYPQPLRHVSFRDTDRHHTFHFLINNFEVPARMVTDLYRLRWRIELLFKWSSDYHIPRFRVGAVLPAGPPVRWLGAEGPVQPRTARRPAVAAS